MKGKFPSLSGLRSKHLQDKQSFPRDENDGFLARLQVLSHLRSLGLFILP